MIIRVILRPSSIFILAMFLLCACNDVRFHAYQSLRGEWLRSDTLQFAYCNASPSANDISAQVELRCDAEYIYRDLWVAVEMLSANSSCFFTDTLQIPIYDSEGVPQGSTVGVLRQLNASIDSIISLQPDDTLRVRIYHIMDDTLLRGIYDVGVKFAGCGRRQYAEN